MTVETFRQRLSQHLNWKLDLVINENRSTMLSILDKRRRWARVSVHKMFLDAPDEVLSAIALYVRGKRRPDREIRNYIHLNLPRYDHSHTLKKRALVTEGKVYDLQAIYNTINHTYFENALNLKITWYGDARRRRRSHITFGQYVDPLKLVKIHRLLDDTFFPENFVHLVVYHEMLHHVIPGKLDENGKFRIHSAEFKERERQFLHYKEASQWEKAHRHLLFDA